MKVEYLRCLLASSDFRSAWRHGAAMTQAAYTISCQSGCKTCCAGAKQQVKKKRPAFGLPVEISQQAGKRAGTSASMNTPMRGLFEIHSVSAWEPTAAS